MLFHYDYFDEARQFGQGLAQLKNAGVGGVVCFAVFQRVDAAL